MEQDVLKFIFNYLKNLKISNCDVYLSRQDFVGDLEKRKKSYITVSFPNGFEYLDAIDRATCVITIGTKDLIAGLPHTGEITRISNLLKKQFPLLTDDYSFLDFEFSSDSSEGVEWHEYYYTLQLYINH